MSQVETKNSGKILEMFFFNAKQSWHYFLYLVKFLEPGGICLDSLSLTLYLKIEVKHFIFGKKYLKNLKQKIGSKSLLIKRSVGKLNDTRRYFLIINLT